MVLIRMHLLAKNNLSVCFFFQTRINAWLERIMCKAISYVNNDNLKKTHLIIQW